MRLTGLHRVLLIAASCRDWPLRASLHEIATRCRFGINVRKLGAVRQQLFALVQHYDGSVAEDAGGDGAAASAPAAGDAKAEGKADKPAELYPVLSASDADELVSNAYSLTTALLMELIARYLKCVLR